FESEVVVRLVEDAQIGDRVTDLLSLVEARAADDTVGNAEGDEPLLELAGLEAGPHQHGHRAQGNALPLQRLDLVADEARLLLPVPEAAQADLLARLALRPQRLAEPPGIPGDEAGCGAEDVMRGPVVALEPDDAGAREIGLEAQDVADLRAAPAIDRLVVVANAADVPVPLGEQAQPEILGHVGVLVLVHQDVAESMLVGPQQLGLA